MNKDTLIVGFNHMSLIEFFECYKPLINNLSPSKLLYNELGMITWERQDFEFIQDLIIHNKVWSIYEFPNEDNDIIKDYIIRPGLLESNNLKGYICTEIPYLNTIKHYTNINNYYEET